MNKKQFNKLIQKTVKPMMFSATDLINKKDRTLLWGYTLDRNSFHVYLKCGKIHLYVYSYDEKEILKSESGFEMDVEKLIPSKRVYPEASDYEFCKKLLDMGINIPFTIFTGDWEERQFYGAIKKT